MRDWALESCSRIYIVRTRLGGLWLLCDNYESGWGPRKVLGTCSEVTGVDAAWTDSPLPCDRRPFSGEWRKPTKP